MTTKSRDLPKSRTSIQSRSLWRGLLLLGFAFLIVWLGVKGWRIGRAAQSMLAQQAVAEEIMAEGLTGIDPQAAGDMVSTIRQNVVTLREETAVFMPLTPYLGWLPQVGPLAQSATQLMEMADAGTETAVHAFAGLQPALTILQAGENNASPLPELVNILAEARPNLALAQQSFERLVVARGQLSQEAQFPGRVQAALDQFDEWAPLAQDGLVMVQVLPDILGHDGRRSYLLLAQNEDELRATGGFISGVGLLTIDNGDILSLDFQDATTFDLESLAANSTAFDYPPVPLRELMGAEYLLLRDANYWPDFPISAQKAIELYQIGRPETQVDGVIALDQQFIAMLVEATGPVVVAGSDTVITGDNAVQSFRDAFNIKEGQTNAEWFQNRKAFLSTFSAAIRQKIEGEPGALNPVTLARNLYAALNSRHLQLYLPNEAESAVLSQLGWDGRLRNPAGQDFLLVLDSNMGFNKTNFFIERAVDYSVDLSQEHPEAHLAVTYRHTSSENDTPCLQWVSYRDAPTYLEVADQCYFNFLRVYTPINSELRWATRHVIPAEMLVTGRSQERGGQTLTEFADFTTFANFVMVPHGQTLITEMTYRLPVTAVQEQTYRLYLRKQAGLGPESISVTVKLPPGSILSTVSAPAAAVVQGQEVTFKFSLTADTVISLSYE